MDNIKNFFWWAISGAALGALTGYGYARVNMPALKQPATGKTLADMGSSSSIQKIKKPRVATNKRITIIDLILGRK